MLCLRSMAFFDIHMIEFYSRPYHYIYKALMGGAKYYKKLLFRCFPHVCGQNINKCIVLMSMKPSTTTGQGVHTLAQNNHIVNMY